MVKKAQAAMEFLMTYGWAILVVLVIIGALGYFGVLSPTALLPEKCIFGVELACKDHKLGAEGKVEMRLQNNLGETMYISQIKVLQDDRVSTLCTQKNDPGTVLGNGQTASFAVSGCSLLSSLENQKIKVYVQVSYAKGAATGLPHRVEGEIFSLVQPAP